MKRLTLLASLALLLTGGCADLAAFLAQPEVLAPVAGAGVYAATRILEDDPPEEEPCGLTLTATVRDACTYEVLLNIPRDGVFDLIVNGTLRGTVTRSSTESLILTDARGIHEGRNILTIRKGDCSATVTVEVDRTGC